MNQLKRWACQTAKVVVGIPLAIIVLILIFGFAGVVGSGIAYLLDNFWIIRALGILLVILMIIGAGFLIGDDVFKKYDICQRFK